MLWLWIPLGVLAGLIVVPLVVGQFLPDRYEGQITRLFGAAPEEVWNALVDYQKHPVSGRRAKSIERLPDENGLPVWVEDMGPSQITIRTVEAEPCSRLVREMKDSVVPMTARTEIEISPIDQGSEVRASTVIELTSGTWHVPYFRFTLWLFHGARLGLKDLLSRVEKTVRAGQPV